MCCIPLSSLFRVSLFCSPKYDSFHDESLDTGKGEIDYSDGVYGLVRAFRVAGARRVLMTLWPVGDEHAKAFMLRFYANWLTPSPATNNSNRDPIIALQQTRLAFLNGPDPALREPRVWAPYVLLVETRAGR